MKMGLVLPVLLTAVLAPAPSLAQGRVSAGEVPEVGVREKLGTTMPMDTLLRDERGGVIRFGDVIDRPTLLLFVYFRCPAICGPLMREVARNLDMLDLDIGKDYKVVTVSFDPTETPEIAAATKAEVLGTMTRRPPDDAWRFLTGDEIPIRVLTEAAGFGYKWDEDSDTYVHASSLIFLTHEGRIVRYLGGLTFVPPEIKMAILDATAGRERSFMQKLAGVCYGFDPESRTYVLRVNRLILIVTGVLVAAFLLFLLVGRGRRGRREASHV